MKIDLRIVFAIVALALGACQGGGFGDSGGVGMPGGGLGPPMQQPGPMGSGEMQGPAIGPNGQPELTAPGATLAPNEGQYPVGDGPSGMKCPAVNLQGQIYGCSISFNLPPPSPSPSPGASGSPKPTATPKATATPDENGDTPT
ncbi:MAG: hypothetical protein JO199_06655, partial [Candidatus Eremiobacteraeota bacterium]|nr:hypothetical protein [Candidatus Eremiobacteraeota bacterium]